MTNPARNPLWPGELDALISACTTAQEKLVILALLETGMTADELGRLTSTAIAGHACTVERATGVVQVRLSAELQEMLREHFRSTAEFGMGKTPYPTDRARGGKAGRPHKDCDARYTSPYLALESACG